MYIPDYGTLQMLYEERLRDFERKDRMLLSIFDIGKGPSESLVQRIGRWLRHNPSVHVTGAKPAHQNG